ncbi:MAG TPA: ABC transporter substrate-binding protein [Chloroflexota bacterium]|nr:ABC transporter substrate-binding protein [Chloroflexota bacterium]
MTGKARISRRRALSILGVGGTVAVLSACSAGAPSASAPGTAATSSAPAAAPQGTPPRNTTAAATTAVGGPTAAAPQAAAGSATEVPRAQTLVLSLSDFVNQFPDVGVMNPFVIGATRNGWQFAFEPLYFYNMWHTDQVCGAPGVACKDGEIPWLAESYSYNADSTELTIKLRQGVTWSDGQPFTADDIVFTLNMLKSNAPKVQFSVDMQTWVKDVTALDPLTAKITLTSGNPRFLFDYFQWHSDIGVPIVPKHIWQGQDPATFTNDDVTKGWPIVTGPWKLTLENPQQRFWDRRDDWWGARTNFHPLPKMQRVTVLPNYMDDKQLELVTANEVDAAHGFQTAYTVPTALARNPKLIAWTADNQPPYGALDIATVTSLAFNCSRPPFDDPDIRWAVNHALNRDEIVAIGSHAIGGKTMLPFPKYGAFVPYWDAVNDLMQKFPIDAFDLNMTAQLMQSKGYAKNSDGFWAKGGDHFSIVLVATPPFFTDIAPVIVEQLRKGGFDTSFKSPSNASTLIPQGDIDAWFDIPGGSARDPYATLNFLHSRYAVATGQPAVRAYRWKNTDFDKLLEAMATTAPTDPKFAALYHQAMEIWFPNLPTIPLINRYIFITPNTTYWTNWPTDKNPYILPSSWHRTAGLFINTLQPVTA